jgi:hypothetical protein
LIIVGPDDPKLLDSVLAAYHPQTRNKPHKVG